MKTSKPAGWWPLTAVFLALVLVGGGARAVDGGRPTGLLCDLLSHPEWTLINNPRPNFSWVVPGGRGDGQSAYRILVATDRSLLDQDRGDSWDSGRVEGDRSVAVEYGGTALRPETAYYWKVRTWGREAGGWSEPQGFRTGSLAPAARSSVATYPVTESLAEPVSVARKPGGGLFVGFGRAAFGTLVFRAESRRPVKVTVTLGEARGPLSTVRYYPHPTRIRRRTMEVEIAAGERDYRVEIPRDFVNTRSGSIRMPTPPGEVMPFRYAEIRAPWGVTLRDFRQVRVHYPFDDGAARFESSDAVLNAVWELCRYSIYATSFAGLYVDGDRERVPYEADAYINQLGHYCTDREYAMGRATHEYLLFHPTGPTEWVLHSVFMAHADWMYTGDPRSIRRFYEEVRPKALASLARPDGLISTRTELLTDAVKKSVHLLPPEYFFNWNAPDDIVDWPKGERDGFEFMPVNTVVNAFHYAALLKMVDLAEAVGRADDARLFAERAAQVKESCNARLFDESAGRYLDGEGSAHQSLHASMFALALGLVPEERRAGVADYVAGRGMACSVYAAQYLLEGLYDAGAEEQALKLLTDTRTDRSWPHMIDMGTTITAEAWDRRYKNNLDWNHAWGAAPANLIPRKLMGIEPAAPGFARARIVPRPGGLAYASIVMPTIRGPVGLAYRRLPDGNREYRLSIPANMRAELHLPAPDPAQVAEGGGPAASAEGVKYLGRRDGRCVFETGGGDYLFTVPGK